MKKTQHVSKLLGGVHNLDGYSDDQVTAMLRGILSTPYSLLREKSHALLKVVEDVRPERQPAQLAYVLTNYGLVPLQSQPGVGAKVPDRTIALVGKYYNDVMFAFRMCMRDNPTAEVLAVRLLTYLRERFTTVTQRSLALTFVLADSCIPYRQLEPSIYGPSLEGDDDTVNVPPPTAMMSLYEMTPGQLMLYHAFYRLGPTPVFAQLMTKLLKQQTGEVEIYNLLYVYGNELSRKSFDDGVQSAQNDMVDDPTGSEETTDGKNDKEG
jgi:hypothetical protein